MTIPANVGKSYATFGVRRSLRQVRHALKSRQRADQNAALMYRLVREAESRMAAQLGRPVEGLRLLEIGPGQGLDRARYFGLKNEVVGMDLDVIPVRFNLRSFLQTARTNGIGRVVKTIGRRLIVGKANEKAWARAVGATEFGDPQMIYDDIGKRVPERGGFDAVTSWSVFEHLPDPRQSLQNVIDALAPSGIFYISIHLYTANNGHHDIRAFTGDAEQLPLWAHLRDSTAGAVKPSAYLNEWRLGQWRELFSELALGHEEYLEVFKTRDRLEPQMTNALRQELAEYSDDELYTINAVYVWRKP